MLAAVHIADLSLRGIREVSRARHVLAAPGLRRFDAGICAPLADNPPRPQPRRWIAFSTWDDEASLKGFEADHPLARHLDGGWSAHLEPLRMHGFWPGLAGDLPTDRATEHKGRTVVVTIAWLRLSQGARFFQQGGLAGVAASEAEGLVWGTAGSKPPHFFITCSVWESTEALSRYAYGRQRPAHSDAMASSEAKPFHHAEAFIRFRPLVERGSLSGRNPFGGT